MERFALGVEDFDRETVEQDILAYANYPLQVEYSGRSLHRVLIKDCSVIVVYDWAKCHFVTALPTDYLIQTKEGKWKKNIKFKKKSIRGFNKKLNSYKKIEKALGRSSLPSTHQPSR